MYTLNIADLGVTELPLSDKKDINGGSLLLGLLIAFGIGYIIGRWIGGDPIPEFSPTE